MSSIHSLSLYAEAHRYVNENGWSVIPITPVVPGDNYRDGKHPSTAGGEWLAYTKRQATDDELQGWFDGRESNIGVVCGEVSGNLVVIDCDDLKTYAALCYVYPALSASLTVETGKGIHIYTTATMPVATTKFTLNGLTHHVKAEGSYVVAPPSVHASGREYAFRDASIAPLMLDPERLSAALKKLGARKPEPEARNEQGWAAQLIRDGARKGERDDLTLKLAAYLNHFLPYDTSLALLELWAGRCDSSEGDPWGLSQVEAKLRSASRYAPSASPRSAPPTPAAVPTRPASSRPAHGSI